jgi:hypothetical protein
LSGSAATAAPISKNKKGVVKMELLPADLRASLPPLYSQERNPDPQVHLKFFTPDSDWTWFVTEGQPQDDDFIFFG